MERFADDVWTETRPAKFFGVECGSRMTVVRMSDGGLFVHSPVGLTDDLRREVDGLGEVRAVVAPSVFHHLHVQAWVDAYPRAVFAACPGLEWKRPDLRFDAIMGDEPHPAWSREIAQVYFSARRENEVVFYLAKQKIFLCCDSLLNLSKHPKATTRFVARLMRNSAPGVGWMEPLMIRDRRIARRQVDRMLEWDFDKALLSHGDLVTSGAHEVVRHAYAWL